MGNELDHQRWIKYYGPDDTELIHARWALEDSEALVPCTTPLPASRCTCGAWELLPRPVSTEGLC